MPCSFDEYGNLKPYQVHSTTLARMKSCFVDKFSRMSSTRHVLWDNYKNYNRDLYREVYTSFKQICFGSFVTQKMAPSDIDIVTLIPSNKVTNKIENYMNDEAVKKYNTDAYIIPVYKSDSPLHAVTQALIDKKLKFGLYDDRTKRRRGALEVEINDETV